MPNEKVELMPAFFWICPECGIDNFLRCPVPSLGQDEEQKLKDEIEHEHGIDLNGASGLLMLLPAEVKCSQCSRIFNSSPYNCDVDPVEDWE